MWLPACSAVTNKENVHKHPLGMVAPRIDSEKVSDLKCRVARSREHPCRSAFRQRAFDLSIDLGSCSAAIHIDSLSVHVLGKLRFYKTHIIARSSISEDED